MTEVLLLVAVVTDQPEIPRRLDTILAAARPVDEQLVRRSTANVWAKPVAELTASDRDRLAALIGGDAVERLNLGDAE